MAPDPLTRQRLLDAAGELFADEGFREATIRAICARAGANVAAVNYHFGDKRALYREVFRHACHCPRPDLSARAGSPRARLRAYIDDFVRRILAQGRPAWQGRLMAREMAEPSGALDDLVETSIRPQFAALAAIIRDLAGGPLSDDVVRRCAGSVVAQCLFYLHSAPVISRLHPGLRLAGDEITAVVAHIVRFSLAGLRAAARVA